MYDLYSLFLLGHSQVSGAQQEVEVISNSKMQQRGPHSYLCL